MHPEQRYDASGAWYADVSNAQMRLPAHAVTLGYRCSLTTLFVALVLYQSAAPAIIQIRNPGLVDVYRAYFTLSWDTNSVTYRGTEAPRFYVSCSKKDIYWIGGNGGLESFIPKYGIGIRRNMSNAVTFIGMTSSSILARCLPGIKQGISVL